MPSSAKAREFYVDFIGFTMGGAELLTWTAAKTALAAPIVSISAHSSRSLH